MPGTSPVYRIDASLKEVYNLLVEGYGHHRGSIVRKLIMFGHEPCLTNKSVLSERPKFIRFLSE